ncbi:MerR family transcriptional regulator [Sphaerimonospora sp. CA-214678]|uniref:helix-turn-helix domain-containing protein n=1 Tax=Sphaerimonospora sp. CA-214678 TaxID=3240029 RepID=UPI003D93EE7D
MDQPHSAADGDTLAHGRNADTPGSKAGSRAEDRFEHQFNDENYPAYSMGAAAEMLGASPAFLRALGAAKLIEPKRSSGGHRRYSRYQLRLAARARELVDQGTPVEAACRIILLEDQLAEALRINNERDHPAGH